jgi:hypothetical protein
MIELVFGWTTPEAKPDLPESKSVNSRILVIGFVGGVRSPHDLKQGVVQIGNRLKQIGKPELKVEMYRHWYWRRAYDLIYQNIDLDRDEKLSNEELERAPRIVIYGHSLGGWAVIKLSRSLEKVGIPVELTVQIDSVGIGDEAVPRNVKFAANFYQRSDILLRGEQKIRVEDEGKTRVLGNYLINSVGHEALARGPEISDFVTEKVLSLCAAP